ncbi:hypothetical protein [Megasphaera sp. UPII 135-E]|uniref:hypothetical protein n=1 Tax=Megasphaera sp. UPII 135-E TaxID=1000569 RepID=UPI00021A1979|nr:hypothetical protein [Megasphaera sp. UPII 135-E]EGS34072.1 hypothetical protein HMPREF1040_0945 [Megasphaera sp. UPII 135-E]MUP59140.1 toxin [Veillonellaceae bacterium M2-4]
MGSGNFGGFKNTKGSLKPEHLMEELRNSGVKFTEEDVVMIAKQKNGELLWLERGNKVAGLIHIEEGHSENLKSAFGVNKNSIPSFIKNVIEQGKIVSNVKKGKRITRIYDFGGKHYVLCALGTNGFIVSVYPR